MHRSYAHERDAQIETNERLEFLGDAALNYLVAEALFERYPELAEGELTRARARLVNRESLARAARSLGIGNAVQLGKGATISGGRQRDSILADTFEAILGAVLLDGGLDACRRLVGRVLTSSQIVEPRALAEKDPKSRLQEHTQRRFKAAPVYRLVSEDAVSGGFVVEVWVQDALVAQGTGASRTLAETEAARAALRSYDTQK